MDKPKTGLSTEDIVKAYQSMSQGQRGFGILFVFMGLSRIYSALTVGEKTSLPSLLPIAVELIVVGLIVIMYAEPVGPGVLGLTVLLIYGPILLTSGVSSWRLGEWMLVALMLVLFFGFVSGISIERKYKQLPQDQQTAPSAERAHLIFPQLAVGLAGLALALFFVWFAAGRIVSQTVHDVILNSSLRAGEMGLSVGLASVYAGFPRKSSSVVAALIGLVIFASLWLFPSFFAGQ